MNEEWMWGRKYFFHDKIADEWNNLPSEGVIVKTGNIFKAKIDTLLWQGGREVGT